MDLRESHPATVNRHPWELARIKALRRIALTYKAKTPGIKVLDLGCGDGFLIDALCCPKSAGVIDAVDIHLTADQLSTFSNERPMVKFHNSYHSLVKNGYELITMFDVLEHVEDDVLFLREAVSRYAAPGSLFFCTVPAFQSLFSSHDTFLKHHRRYSLPVLEQLLDRAGLRVVRSGYLFGIILPIRVVAVLVENFFGGADKDPGIGHWRHGRLLTSMIAAILDADNFLLLCLNKIGIKIPGLTVWAVCETPR